MNHGLGLKTGGDQTFGQTAEKARCEPFVNNAAKHTKVWEARYADIAMYGTASIQPFSLGLVAASSVRIPAVRAFGSTFASAMTR